MSTPAPGPAIDGALFLLAFGGDTDYHDVYPLTAFLDRQTGDVLWAYADDEEASWNADVAPEENADLRRRVEADPERYLEVPGLSHGDHHDILRAFLASEWTGDGGRRTRAREAYSGSIGRWVRRVGDDGAVRAYYDYQDRAVVERAEGYLRAHGVDPVWR